MNRRWTKQALVILVLIRTTFCSGTGCYNFAAANKQIRENDAKKRALDAEIQKEMERRSAARIFRCALATGKLR